MEVVFKEAELDVEKFKSYSAKIKKLTFIFNLILSFLFPIYLAYFSMNHFQYFMSNRFKLVISIIFAIIFLKLIINKIFEQFLKSTFSEYDKIYFSNNLIKSSKTIIEVKNILKINIIHPHSNHFDKICRIYFGNYYNIRFLHGINLTNGINILELFLKNGEKIILPFIIKNKKDYKDFCDLVIYWYSNKLIPYDTSQLSLVHTEGVEQYLFYGCTTYHQIQERKKLIFGNINPSNNEIKISS